MFISTQRVMARGSQTSSPVRMCFFTEGGQWQAQEEPQPPVAVLAALALLASPELAGAEAALLAVAAEVAAPAASAAPVAAAEPAPPRKSVAYQPEPLS